LRPHLRGRAAGNAANPPRITDSFVEKHASGTGLPRQPLRDPMATGCGKRDNGLFQTTKCTQLIGFETDCIWGDYPDK